ncbi:MAG: response regulator [Verrucomicrobia bacterium]|nr:response regulator [Verrucomicrobiota bacterium]
MPQLSILVADDEQDICVLLEQWLAPLGHAVLTAGNGTEALKLIAAHPVDLVVTDILMPEGDGLKVMEGLRKTRPAARVLAISGGGRYMDGREYLKIAQGLGADAAIMKPFTRDQFLAAIGQALARRSAAGLT